MKQITDLSKFKDKKKYQKVVEDLDKILHIFALTQKSLSFYKCYKNVQEVISIVETNKTLMELYVKKYSKELEKINAED